MEKIIFKYLNESLTSEEWEKLKAWLESSPENKATLNKLSSYVSNVDKERDLVRLEVWDDLQERIAEYEGTGNRLYMQSDHSTSYAFAYWLKLAAVLLTILASALITYKIANQDQTDDEQIAMISEVTNPGQKRKMVLSDGSRIVLNSGSTIEVPEKFSVDKREVILNGEAFFDVARDESRPFIIHSGDFEVEVLGTSFNVKAYENEEIKSVAVSTGKVKVTNLHDSEFLTPGEMVSIADEYSDLKKSSFDKDREFGWMSNKLIFQGENLNQIIKVLSRQYGIDFAYDAQSFTKSKGFSGRFEDMPLSEVLNGLAYVYDFEFAIRKNKVEIEKKR